MKTLFMGIDPGDRWCGVVTMRVHGKKMRIDQGVIDRTLASSYVQVVNLITPSPGVFGEHDEVRVANEAFRFRPVGHQAFAAPLTAHLIGAIRYITESNGGHWTEVQPGNIWEDMRQLGVHQWPTIMSDYRLRAGDGRWDHCDSAWRVLFMAMFNSQHREFLMTLRDIHNPSIRMIGKNAQDFPHLIAPSLSVSLL